MICMAHFSLGAYRALPAELCLYLLMLSLCLLLKYWLHYFSLVGDTNFHNMHHVYVCNILRTFAPAKCCVWLSLWASMCEPPKANRHGGLVFCCWQAGVRMFRCFAKPKHIHKQHGHAHCGSNFVRKAYTSLAKFVFMQRTAFIHQKHTYVL